MKVRLRKNAGEGYGFNFHGAFTDKADAEKKEAKTPGSFIRGRLTQHGYRWIVMTPRKNPIKRRRHNPIVKGWPEILRISSKSYAVRLSHTAQFDPAADAVYFPSLKQAKEWIRRKRGETAEGRRGRSNPEKQHESKIFDTGTIQGLKAAERYKARLQNKYESVNVYTVGLNRVQIVGMKESRKNPGRTRYGAPTHDYCQMCGRKSGLREAPDPDGNTKTLCRLCRVESHELLKERGVQKNPGELIVLGANPMAAHAREIEIPAGSTITIRTNPGLQANPICGNPVGGGMRCSRKPGHKGPHLPQGATLRPRSRVPGSWVGRRSNPSAAAIREEFTGTPSEKFFVQDVAGIPAGDYAQLGELLALYVKPVDGGQRQTIDFRQGERPLLICDETRRQLYFLDGDQDVSGSLSAFHAQQQFDGLMLLGELRRIDYKQRKEHADQPDLDEWRHDLGEETGVYPSLLFDPANKRLVLQGGEYEVRREGIVN